MKDGVEMKYQFKMIIRYIVIVTFAVVFCLFINPDLEIHRFEFVLNAVITTSTTISGFILTSLSIIFGLSRNTAFKAIKDNHLVGELIWLFTESLSMGLVVIVYCVVLGSVFPEDLQFIAITSIWFKVGVCIVFWHLTGVILLCRYVLGLLSYDPDATVVVDNTPQIPKGSFRV